MKKILKNLKIGSFIGIYIFEEEIFSIGKILNISKDYLYLENYDINGEIIGIKIFLINSIRRIILSSKYINRLKEKNKDKGNIKINDFKSFNTLFSLIIKNKITILVKMVDGSSEASYLFSKKNNIFHFNFLNDSFEVNSDEVIYEDYIEEIQILSKIDIILEKKINKLKRIKMYNGKFYNGKVFYQDKKFILFERKEEFSTKSSFLIIPFEKVQEISESIEEKKFKKINIKKLITDKEMELYKILKIALRYNLLVSIDNSNFTETKIGKILDLQKEILKFKEMDENENFFQIIDINYSDIEILQIINFSN